MPLVVTAMSGRGDKPATAATSFSRSLNISGSPPVNRTLSIPRRVTAIPMSLMYSSVVSSVSLRSHSSPSAGIQ
ncbi:Uncharacterised protein [Mycobacteroides abscessus subsp. abscessus]|nr:Uncharacterised protein [Mycobacteroides abscessus subsp. abscessus]